MPIEMQKAGDIYQIENQIKLSKPSKKQIVREAFAQIFWHEYPEETIEGICRGIHELKKEYKGDEFLDAIYDSFNRNKGVIKKLQPKLPKSIFPVPGVIEINENSTALNFQKLKLVLKTICRWLFTENSKLRLEEFFAYPLVGYYLCDGIGNSIFDRIVSYILQEEIPFLLLNEGYTPFITVNISKNL